MVYMGYVYFAYNLRNVTFLSFATSRPVLGPIQPPIHWITGALHPGVKWHSVKLTTHLHLVPRSRMMELHLHSPTYPNGIELNYITKYRDNFTLIIIR
jgi:hypothetical protein